MALEVTVLSAESLRLPPPSYYSLIPRRLRPYVTVSSAASACSTDVAAAASGEHSWNDTLVVPVGAEFLESRGGGGVHVAVYSEPACRLVGGATPLGWCRIPPPTCSTASARRARSAGSATPSAARAPAARPRRRAPRRPRPRRPRPAASAAACPVDAAGAARVVPRGDGHPGVGDIRRRGGDAGVGGVGRRGGGVAVIDRDAARQRERLPVEKRWKNSSPGRTYFYLFFVLIETLTNPVMGWSNVSSARRVVLRVYVYTYVHARKLPLAAIRMYIQPTYV